MARAGIDAQAYALVIPAHPPHFKYLSGLVEASTRWSVPPSEIIIAASEIDEYQAASLRNVVTAESAMTSDVTVAATIEKTPAGLNRNRGWHRAESPWVVFADADDIYRPERPEVALGRAVATGSVAVVHGFAYLKRPGSFLSEDPQTTLGVEARTEDIRPLTFPSGEFGSISPRGSRGESNLVLPEWFGQAIHHGHLVVRTELRNEFSYSRLPYGEDGVLLREMVFAEVPLLALDRRLSLYDPWRWAISPADLLRQSKRWLATRGLG